MSQEILGTTLGKARRSRWGRTKLITASVVAILCLMWFVPWAYVRMTTPVGRAHDDYSDLFEHFYSSDDHDATGEWLAALDAIPTEPTFDEPPPPGMKWEFESGSAPLVEVTDVNRGRWDPASRPVLRVVMRYISSPQMNSALERVVALRDRPFTFDINFGQMPSAPPKVSFSEIRQIAKIMCARSRSRSETGDRAGGWEDLRTVLAIRRTAPQDTLISHLVLTATEALALNELRVYLRETTIDQTLARDIERVLDSLPEAEQSWRDAMAGEWYFGLHEIDSCFSDDGQGNGWLVLSAQPDWNSFWTGTGAASAPKRSKFWNLLSPLYHDRLTATTRLQVGFTRRVAAVDMRYSDAVAQLSVVGLSGAYEPADGPWLHLSGRGGSACRAYQVIVRQFATRRATRIMAALSWFKGEHGHFPAQLDDLVPGFIPALPDDPFCGGRFGYRLAGDDYHLYSCGFDGDDDGGRMGQTSGGTPRAFAEEGDDIYTFRRSPAFTIEPVAVPVDPGGAGPAGEVRP